MTKDRFETLAEAYGGDIARWPDAEREAAALMMAAEPAFTQAVLSAAGDLDAALDAWPVAKSHPALVDRILANAPQPRSRRGWRGWMVSTGLGAALAGACAAGLLVGVQISPLTAPLATTDTSSVAAADDASDFDPTSITEEVG